MPVAEKFQSADVYLRDVMNEVESLPAPRAGMGRRAFLKMSGLAGGGLVLAFCLDLKAARAANDTLIVLNAFVRIAPDNSVTLYSKGPEIGQGIKTAFALIIAEELDADWKNVKVEQARINPKVYGNQSAGGSTSIPRGWDQLRQAGATARAMLIAAAAKQWNAPAGECTAADSVVTHTPSGRKLSYGALATAGAAMPVPDAATVPLKARKDYKLLGKRYTGVDNLKVVTGQPLFGIDTRLPGMLYANYTKCPAVGGKVKSANLDAIKKLPGVKDAFVIEGNGRVAEVMPGVAIIANSTWAAFKAKAALQVEWDESAASKDSMSAIRAQAKAIAAKGKGATEIVAKGDVDGALKGGKMVEAFYDYPFLSHAPLEPQNCTAWRHDGILEMWNPTQTPDRGLSQVAAIAGLPDDNVIMHQTRVGGGFGRRLVNDYACEAAAIAMRVNAPVKLQWKREDDFAHDYYRAAGFHSLRGAVDAQGKLTAWDDHLISFTADDKNPVNGGNLPADEFPANVLPTVRYTQTLLPLLVPCGAWRAPRSNGVAFAIQSFINELAVAGGRDHQEFLVEIMGQPRWLKQDDPGAMNTERAIGVIKLAAEKAGWGKTLPKGSGMGLAFHFSHAGHFAEVVELSVDSKKHITVHHITVAGDIGPVINLSGAENQCQGAALDGLSTMSGLEVTFEKGRIEQANYNAYTPLRMRSAPPVAVYFLQSDYRPTGVGEPALPPVAAAVCNAIFAATGERVRSLPLKKAGYTI
jgi:isoquinoline 1-oxidoreductase beta subunit